MLEVGTKAPAFTLPGDGKNKKLSFGRNHGSILSKMRGALELEASVW